MSERKRAMARRPVGQNGTVRSRLPRVHDLVMVVAGLVGIAAVGIGMSQYVLTSVDTRMQAMEERLRGDIAVVRGEVGDVRREVSDVRREISDVRKEVARIDARLVRVETIVSEIRNRSDPSPS